MGPGSLSCLMENQAPPVVAVIVTHDPGPWFEETLESLAAQDYPELSVLVLDAASTEDPTPRVASVIPGAFVRRLPSNAGFAASADEVLQMVQGASHYLLCHDDVALDPDVVHVMVEESFRSNAGIVAPKLVSWDDPARLLHVGMAVDKGGTVVDRVEPGEIDHGQHDAVRDVFLAPGGCTLVRADLFAELGGFDPTIVAMGEDLDLCWRAQIAGARVVVAPSARVRHLEGLASGSRPAPSGPTLQELQRRHELRAALTAYGPFHLVRVLPQLLALAAAELGIASVTGNRARASALVGAWRWNWATRKDLRAARSGVRGHRRLSDSEVRRLQLHGSARLSAYLRRAVTHGWQVAHAGADAEAEALDAAEDPGPEGRRELGLTGRLVAWVAAAAVLLVGSRQLLGLGLPYVSGFLPLPSVSVLLHRFVSGWQPTGVGTTDPTSPTTALLALLAFVLGGSVGLAQKVAILGCIPVGALGMTRLARPFGSSWARVAATLAYLAVPVAYNAMAQGRWDALVAYAVAPWLLARLARASGLAPFAVVAGTGRWPWRRRLPGQILALGALEALACAVAPAVGALALIMVVALAGGMVLVGGRGSPRAAARVLVVGAGATAVSMILLAPWSLSLLTGPGRWQAVTGVGSSPGGSPTWGALLRLSVGPIGDTPLAYGLVAAALLPLVIAARRRLAWAGCCLAVIVGTCAVAWAAGRGWLGGFAPPAALLLAGAAVGVALAAGLGVAAFELDLSAYRFGWRQASVLVAGLAAVVGALPVLGATGGGRWDLPATGYGEATAWMAAHAPPGGFRVLWLGDPRVLPGAGWELAPGVAYSLSEGGLPDVTNLWPGSSQEAAATVAAYLRLAEAHDTVQLGALLAPYAVRYVVVVDSLAPEIPGYQSPLSDPAPPGLAAALGAQDDLRQVPGQGGMAVYVDDAALPEWAAHTEPVSSDGASPSLVGWVPAFTVSPSATSATRVAPAGALVVGRAPAAAWQLLLPPAAPVPAYQAFGYAARFDLALPGPVTVRFRGSWAHGAEVAAEVVAWLVVAALLVGRRRWLPRWARHVGRRSA